MTLTGDRYGPELAHPACAWCDTDRAMIKHAPCFTTGRDPGASGGRTTWRQPPDDASRVAGHARMGDDRRFGVVNADRPSWNVPNLSVSDGPASAGTGRVNPSLMIRAPALHAANRIQAFARRGGA